MNELAERKVFCDLLIQTMLEHPDWTPDIFKAMADGSELAIGSLELKAAKYRSAITAALTLSMSKAGIKNEQIRKACIKQVLEVLSADTDACKLDKDFAKSFVLETLTKKEIDELLTQKKNQEPN